LEINCIRLMLEFVYSEDVDLQSDANLALLVMALANRFQVKANKTFRSAILIVGGFLFSLFVCCFCANR
jgi:hypothetical protein